MAARASHTQAEGLRRRAFPARPTGKTFSPMDCFDFSSKPTSQSSRRVARLDSLIPYLSICDMGGSSARTGLSDQDPVVACRAVWVDSGLAGQGAPGGPSFSRFTLWPVSSRTSPGIIPDGQGPIHSASMDTVRVPSKARTGEFRTVVTALS